jgi:hypothetical protein
MALMEVFLEPFELFQAWGVGKLRQARAIAAGRLDAHGFCGDPERTHILGASGEVAACKALNREWDRTVDTYKAPDIRPDIQVRTRFCHSYDLLIRNADKDDERYILVTWEHQRPTRFLVRGWLWGYEAKQTQFLQGFGNRPKAYFVPATRLHSICNLA